MRTKTKYLILGAGPTGLGAAWRLKELGEKSFLLVEKSKSVGGLASSFKDPKGFVWDIGGHVLFSHYQYFDDLMNKAIPAEGWLTHQRESWAWMKNRFVPYPVQNNIRFFPKEDMWKCLQGLIGLYKEKNRPEPKNFKEWILSIFGEGLAEMFMLPYNYKVWAYAPEKMSYQWVGERVAVTDLARVTGNILFEKDDVSWGPNSTFRFPLRGGTGAIWESVGRLVGDENILLDRQLAKLDLERKLATFSNGDEIEFEKALSTLPVDVLYKLISPSPPGKLRELSGKLLYSSSNIVGLGVRLPIPPALETKCWMYFPEGDCPFYRATVFSNYSPNNVPDSSRYWSLMTETSESPDKKVDQESLIEDTIQGALNTGLIKSREDVVSTWRFRAEHGYPTPFLGRDEIVEALLSHLEQSEVYSRGRFGAWKYEVSNQDHSLMQGVEWVNRAHLNVPETTLHFPAVANADWGRF